MMRPPTIANGVAKTPPMGWNSWNSFGGNPSEMLVTQMADAMIDSGMRDVGYEYVVIDDCWFDPDRDDAGNLRAAADRFPNGMPAVGNYLHERGLKFGIYAGPLGRTCAQYNNDYPGATGSEGHEEADAEQFAAWGVDFLKYDWCSPVGSIDEQVEVFARMRDCLAATGRPMVFSINPNSFHTKTGPDRDWGDVANMWRTTEDIRELWDRGAGHDYPMGVKNIVEVTLPLADQARPGAWNDMDMLEVGRDGLTEEEQRTHFALWAVMSSPLIAGNDLRTMTDATRDLLTNADLIAMNQDPLGVQAKQVSFDGTCRVLAKPLANGDIAVALYNQGEATTTITTSAAAVGKIGTDFTVRDAWTGETATTTATISADVPAHGVVVYRLGNAAGEQDEDIARAGAVRLRTSTVRPTATSPASQARL